MINIISKCALLVVWTCIQWYAGIIPEIMAASNITILLIWILGELIDLNKTMKEDQHGK